MTSSDGKKRRLSPQLKSGVTVNLFDSKDLSITLNSTGLAQADKVVLQRSVSYFRNAH